MFGRSHGRPLTFLFAPRAPRRFGKRLYGGSYPRHGWTRRVVGALVLGLLPVSLGLLTTIPPATAGSGGALAGAVSWAFGAFALVGFAAAMSATVRATPRLDIRARGFTAVFVELSVVQPLGPFPGGKIAGFFAVPREAPVAWAPDLAVVEGRPMIGLRVEARMKSPEGSLEHYGQRYFHGQDIDVRAALEALRSLYGDRWSATWHPQPITDLRFAGAGTFDPQELLRMWLDVTGPVGGPAVPRRPEARQA